MWRKLVFNAPRMIGRRKQLRNNTTEAEKILWERLRKSQLGVKFIRQYSIENYVIDFFCPARKFAIELDGKSHRGKEIYDKYRTKTIEAYGIKEIRFLNDEVINKLGKVIEKIAGEI